MLTGPTPACRKALDVAGLSASDIDLVVLQVPALELVHQRAQDHGAGGSQRVAHGDRAAVDVAHRAHSGLPQGPGRRRAQRLGHRSGRDQRGLRRLLAAHEHQGRAVDDPRRAACVVQVLDPLDLGVAVTGPTPACRKALDVAGLSASDIDLVEINEAFAAIPLKLLRDMGWSQEQTNVNGGATVLPRADPRCSDPLDDGGDAHAAADAQGRDPVLQVPALELVHQLKLLRDMGWSQEQTNVNGGAIAMGHPLGATGAMILGTLVLRRIVQAGEELPQGCRRTSDLVCAVLPRADPRCSDPLDDGGDTEPTMISWQRDDDLVILTMDDPGAPVNTMNDAYQDALEKALERLEAERDSIRGVVLTSAKKGRPARSPARRRALSR
jgi:hypothetical protein